MIVGRKFAVSALIIGAGASAQEFEVASIKPAAPDERRMFIGPGPGGGISVTNMTLKQTIQNAWHIMPAQISGGPAWIDSKPEKKPAPEESMRMLQALLRDRFQLVIHSETKEMPVYTLVLARKDGKLGENLTESKEGGCTVPDPNQPPPLLRGGKLGCGGAIVSQRSMNGVSVPMTGLARSLSLMVGRIVIDETGLTAKYDYPVEFSRTSASRSRARLRWPRRRIRRSRRCSQRFRSSLD
jgi:uncharacterized protein (TIGR03435 family)